MPSLPPYLGVKNAHRLHHYTHRTAPWIRLYVDLLDDPKFLALTPALRGYYMTLYLLAGTHSNRIPSDDLEHLMKLDHKPDLTPLFRAGFLLASRASKRASKEANKPLDSATIDDGMQIDLNLNLTPNPEEENAKKESIGEKRIVKGKNPLNLSDEEFLEALRASPAYQYLSVDLELAQMDIWLMVNPDRHKTRRFIVGWLNKAADKVRPVTVTRTPKEPVMSAAQRKMEAKEAELRRKEADENPV